MGVGIDIIHLHRNKLGHKRKNVEVRLAALVIRQDVLQRVPAISAALIVSVNECAVTERESR